MAAATRPLTIFARSIAAGVTQPKAWTMQGMGMARVNNAQLNYQQASEVLMSNYGKSAPLKSPQFKAPLKMFTNFRGEVRETKLPNVPYAESYVKLSRR